MYLYVPRLRAAGANMLAIADAAHESLRPCTWWRQMLPMYLERMGV